MNGVTEEYGLSAQQMSDIHHCNPCTGFRPAQRVKACGGGTVTLWAYCAFQRIEFCSKRCNQYEEKAAA